MDYQERTRENAKGSSSNQTGNLYKFSIFLYKNKKDVVTKQKSAQVYTETFRHDLCGNLKLQADNGTATAHKSRIYLFAFRHGENRPYTSQQNNGNITFH